MYLQCLNTTICANSLLFETLFILGVALNEQRCRSRRTETSYSALSALELAVKGSQAFLKLTHEQPPWWSARIWGCTRHASIRPNKHNGPQSITAFPRENTCGYALLQANLLDLFPARFPTMGETGNFSACADGKAGGAPDSIKKVPGPKWKRQFSSECARLIGSYRSFPCVTPHRTPIL